MNPTDHAIELRHLRYFLLLADELHFTRAARRLGIAQSALSRQMRDLERAVGAPLFIRGTRSVALSPAGAALLEGAGRTLTAVDRALEAARAAPTTVPARIGYTSYAMSAGIGNILERFAGGAPDVVFDLIEDSTAGNLKAVRAGALDAAFVTHAGMRSADLQWVTAREEPLNAALPSDHRLARRRRIPLASLADEPFVLFPRRLAPGFHDHILAACARAGFHPKTVRRAAGYDRIRAVVASERCASLIPLSASRVIPGLRYVALEEAPVVTLNLIWARRASSPVIQALAASLP